MSTQTNVVMPAQPSAPGIFLPSWLIPIMLAITVSIGGMLVVWGVTSSRINYLEQKDKEILSIVDANRARRDVQTTDLISRITGLEHASERIGLLEERLKSISDTLTEIKVALGASRFAVNPPRRSASSR